MNMFNLNNEVQKLSAIPKSRLTKDEILTLYRLKDILNDGIKGLKKTLEKIDVQLEQRS